MDVVVAGSCPRMAPAGGPPVNVESGQIRHIFIRNAQWAAIGTFFRYFVAFFVTLLLGRYLGAGAFGNYQYYLSILALVESLSAFFNYTVVQNDLIAERIKFEKVWGVFRVLGPALGAAFVGFSWWTASRGFWGDVDPTLLATLHVALVFRFTDALALRLSAKLNQHLQQMCDIVVLLIFNGARVAVLLAGLDIKWLILCTVLQYALTSAAYVGLSLWRSDLPLRGSFDGRIAQRLFLKSLPMYSIVVLSVVQGRINNLLLPQLISLHDMGLYAFAAKMIEPVGSLCLLALNTSIPILSHSFTDSAYVYHERLKRVFGATIVLASVIVFVTLVLPLDWMLGLIQRDFTDAGVLMPILALAVIGQAFTAVCNFQDAVSERFARSLGRNLSLAILQTAVSVVFIRLWGIRGAAFAIVLIPLMANFAMNLFLEDCRDLNRIFLGSFAPRRVADSMHDLKVVLLKVLRRS